MARKRPKPSKNYVKIEKSSLQWVFSFYNAFMKNDFTLQQLRHLLAQKQDTLESLRRQRDQIDRNILQLEGKSDRKPKTKVQLVESSPALADVIISIAGKLNKPTSIGEYRDLVVATGYQTSATPANLLQMVGFECRKRLQRVERGKYQIRGN